jgi:hypothetical protein
MRDSLPPHLSSPETEGTGPVQFFECPPVALPPGTRARPRPRRGRGIPPAWWWLAAGAALAALVAGLLVGHFLPG